MLNRPVNQPNGCLYLPALPVKPPAHRSRSPSPRPPGPSAWYLSPSRPSGCSAASTPPRQRNDGWPARRGGGPDPFSPPRSGSRAIPATPSGPCAPPRRRQAVRTPGCTLRHAAASVMLTRGVPLEVVSDILGHSSIAITGDTYGHVSPDVARRAKDTLGDALDRWSIAPRHRAAAAPRDRRTCHNGSPRSRPGARSSQSRELRVGRWWSDRPESGQGPFRISPETAPDLHCRADRI
ncbi:tyrosine-type recombinase/integrase [Geodermatophilus poikilotrophus]|uniref:tyrosine-type recombinase/integrase n=1 Tax=Geodermatophilus poikilotrophus TaxID=1333667 RepID=UPI003CCC0315